METEKNEITVPSLVEGLESLVFSMREQPEEAVRVLSRRHFETTPDFFVNTERLNDDPIMAASLVRATSEDYEINPNPKSLENIVINAALAAAKIETAEESLNPTKEKRGLFDGLKENLIGLAAFVSNSKRLRNASIASLLVASMAAGCKSVDVATTQEIPTESSVATRTSEVARDATGDGAGTVERAEPSPTPDARFQDLLPETLAEVGENNVLRRDHLEGDLAALVEREKEANTESSEVPEFSVLRPNYDIEKLKYPSTVALSMVAHEGETISIVSCSYLDMGNGEGFYVLGIPIRRPDSQNVGILHFAMDPDLAKVHFETIGKDQTYEDHNNIQKYYSEAIYGGKEISSMGIILVSWRGYADEGGIWDSLFSIVKGSWTDYSVDAGLLVSWQTLNPDTGEMVKLKSEDEREYLDRVERIIFPAISIGVSY